MRQLMMACVLALWATAAAAQTAGPGSKVAFEIDPGRMAQGTGTVPRPITNVRFEQRIDGGAPSNATLDAPCTPATAPQFTCVVRLPTMSEGVHMYEVRGTPNPAESGIPAGGWGGLSVTVVVTAAPSAPANMRLIPPAGDARKATPPGAVKPK